MKYVILALSLSLPVLSLADSQLSRRIAHYKPICENRDRAHYEAECHRLPGGHQYVYEMTGDKRSYAMKQANKVVQTRRNHDQHMGNWRNKRAH